MPSGTIWFMSAEDMGMQYASYITKRMDQATQ